MAVTITPIMIPTSSMSIGSSSDSIRFILSLFSSVYSSDRFCSISLIWLVSSPKDMACRKDLSTLKDCLESAFESFFPFTSSSDAFKKALDMTLFFIVFDESLTACTKVTPEFIRTETMYENFANSEVCIIFPKSGKDSSILSIMYVNFEIFLYI